MQVNINNIYKLYIKHRKIKIENLVKYYQII